MKKNITWVTIDYFVDCDINQEVISLLLKKYIVKWIVLLPDSNARYCEKDFEKIKQLPGITVEFLRWTYRARNPKMISFYKEVSNRIREIGSDLTYINLAPESPYSLFLYWNIDRSKAIITAHDGDTKSSFKFPALTKIMFDLVYKKASYVNLFSETQTKAFTKLYKHPRTFTIPLSLKNFGESTVKKRTDDVIFLFFGAINSNKNLSILIQAACNLYESGIRGFRISIHGFCQNWETYQSQIKYSQIFETEIRFHENHEIPNLVVGSHYMVFPYKEVSQSGAIKVAFQYNTPVIVSDLPGFLSEVEDQVNGFVFKSNVVSDLERVMRDRIQTHTETYDNLRKKMEDHSLLHYSPATLAGKYISMFNTVIENSDSKTK